MSRRRPPRSRGSSRSGFRKTQSRSASVFCTPASRATIPFTPVPRRKGAISNRANLLGPGALVASGDGELDPLVVLEAAVAVSLDGGVVDEDVRRAVIGGDETIALVRVEPLHCALSHVLSCRGGHRDARDVHPGLWRPPVIPRPGLETGGARGQNFAGAVRRT